MGRSQLDSEGCSPDFQRAKYSATIPEVPFKSQDRSHVGLKFEAGYSTLLSLFRLQGHCAVCLANVWLLEERHYIGCAEQMHNVHNILYNN